MTENEGEPDVPVAVSTPSAATEDDGGRTGPIVSRADYTVVVPVPEALLGADEALDVRRYLRTATALAADNDGQVLLLGLVTVGEESALDTVREALGDPERADGEHRAVVDAAGERQAQLSEMASVARDVDPTVNVYTTVRVAAGATQGLLDAADRDGETAVLLLRTGRDGDVATDRSTVETIFREGDCNVFVENVEPDESSALYVPDIDGHTVAPLGESTDRAVDSVLLAVGTGPHSALATEAARAIGRDTGASVTVIHVVDPDTAPGERADAKELLRFAEYVLGGDVAVESELLTAPDATAAIVERAREHDYAVIGAPGAKSDLRRLVFDSVPETLTEHSDATVLVARDADRTVRSLYYRWKQRMDDGSSE